MPAAWSLDLCRPWPSTGSQVGCAPGRHAGNQRLGRSAWLLECFPGPTPSTSARRHPLTYLLCTLEAEQAHESSRDADQTKAPPLTCATRLPGGITVARGPDGPHQLRHGRVFRPDSRGRWPRGAAGACQVQGARGHHAAAIGLGDDARGIRPRHIAPRPGVEILRDTHWPARSGASGLGTTEVNSPGHGALGTRRRAARRVRSKPGKQPLPCGTTSCSGEWMVDSTRARVLVHIGWKLVGFLEAAPGKRRRWRVHWSSSAPVDPGAPALSRCAGFGRVVVSQGSAPEREAAGRLDSRAATLAPIDRVLTFLFGAARRRDLGSLCAAAAGRSASLGRERVLDGPSTMTKRRHQPRPEKPYFVPHARCRLTCHFALVSAPVAARRASAGLPTAWPAEGCWRQTRGPCPLVSPPNSSLVARMPSSSTRGARE